jgi:sporulation protein YlmC with PRC-barrel domain
MTTAQPVVLLKATDLQKLPVVSIVAGEIVAEIRDVVYSPSVGALLGFTLNKHGGLFAGPMKEVLALASVHAIGRDALMVADAGVLGREIEDAGGGRAQPSSARNVLGNEVLTDAGERLGVVTDLIVEVGVLDPGHPHRRGRGQSHPGQVVGYQLKGDADLQGREGAAELFVPLPNTLAVSGTTLMVPASVSPFIRNDLSGFGGAVDDFRVQLDGSAS